LRRIPDHTGYRKKEDPHFASAGGTEADEGYCKAGWDRSVQVKG